MKVQIEAGSIHYGTDVVVYIVKDQVLELESVLEEHGNLQGNSLAHEYDMSPFVTLFALNDELYKKASTVRHLTSNGSHCFHFEASAKYVV